MLLDFSIALVVETSILIVLTMLSLDESDYRGVWSVLDMFLGQE
jgi:hypothetical protein